MGEADFVIRAANPGDTTALALLATEFGYPNNRADIADRLGQVLTTAGHRVLVAEPSENEIVGFKTQRVFERPLVGDRMTGAR